MDVNLTKTKKGRGKKREGNLSISHVKKKGDPSNRENSL